MKKVMLSIGSLFGGGAERVVSVWADQLSVAGFDVSLLLYGRGEREYQVDKKIKIYTVVDHYCDFKKMKPLARILRMRSIITQEAPDTLISFLPRNQIMTAIACLGKHINRIDTVRISPWSTYQDRFFERQLWKLCFQLSRFVIVQNFEQMDFFPCNVRKKCVVVSNPLDSYFIEYTKHDYPLEPTRFVAVGRITRQKNYSLMIRSFVEAHKINPRLTLDIYGNTGDVIYKDELDNLIGELCASNFINFRGFSTRMLNVFKKYDAFIMTSDFEGMPNSLAEAMACSLLCISTSCRTGPRDMIDDQINGFLVPPCDAEAVKDAIIKVSRLKSEEAKEIACNAREKILSLCGKDRSVEILKTIV